MSSNGGGGGGGAREQTAGDNNRQEKGKDKEDTEANRTREHASAPVAAAAAGLQTTGGAPPPRRPRPLRPNLRRQVVVAAPMVAGPDLTHHHHHHHQVGVPLAAQIELANALQPGRATIVPPKRPTQLPARFHHHAHHHHHRPPQTSLGATVSTGGKPNRYSWAQMQQWQAASALAAAAAAASDPTGGQPAATAGNGDDQTGAAAAAAAAAHNAGNGGAHQHGFHYHFSSPFSSAASRVLVVNPIVNLSEHTKSRLVKFIEALKRFSEKWFSHVLLLLFLAVYACFGAYIFISFEAPTEQWEKQLIIDTRLRIVNESYDQARASSRDDYLELFRGHFEEYERLLNRVCASGMTSGSLENQWTFWGALFYSMTVFTTIGYGHLTPITFAGRVATMVYAIFGIPILLMVLADLGKLLTRIIKFAFIKFRYLYNKLLRRKASVRTRKLISDNTNQYIGVARDALERGMARYIQPYYHERLPQAFARVPGVSRIRQQHFMGHRKAQPGDGMQANVESAGGGGGGGGGDTSGELGGAEQPEAGGKQAHKMESSDVIVTPGKQTKPVSPEPRHGNSKKSPLADHNHQHQHHTSGEHQAGGGHGHHKGGRSQSPGLQGKRKISNSNKQHNSSNSNSYSSQQQVDGNGGIGSGSGSGRKAHKQPISRSSSSFNVIGAQPVVAAAAAPAAVVEPSDTASRTEHATDTSKLTGALSGGTRQAEGEMEPQDLEQQQQQHEPPRLHAEFLEEGEVEAGAELEEEEVEEVEDEDDFDIPVSFALFLLITYMMFGAVVFSIWEGWNFFDALYFVFISMSTIGFGDLVPQHPKRMIGTFAYLLFGLALTSMCINVVQEKIHATFLRAKMQIGEKMGFDLDQIMADDYYDGGSAFDDYDEGGAGGGGGEDDSNSVAVSQSNSNSLAPTQDAIGSHQQANNSGDHHHHHHHHHQHQHQQRATASDTTADTNSSTAPVAVAAASKQTSKGKQQQQHHQQDKWKKRGSGSDSGGSLRRKLSTRRLNRQPTPAASDHPSKQNKPAAVQEGGNLIALTPIKSQIEIIRTAGLPVVESGPQPRPNTVLSSQQDQPQSSTTANQTTPAINQPIGSIKAYCEPLRRAFQGAAQNAETAGNNRQQQQQQQVGANCSLGAARPRLVASSSQPTPAASKSLNSSPIQKNSDARHQANNRTRLSTNPSTKAATFLAQFAKPKGRSLGSSPPRRASVSDELHQLDDLIVALSRSPPERYGPLLGIPAAPTSGNRSNSSRSVSPSASSASTTFEGRRGTSMTCRPTRAAADAAAVRLGSSNSASSTARPQVQKKRSLASQMPPSTSTSLGRGRPLANHDQPESLDGLAHQARLLRSASQRRRRPPLSSSESQAALDELEATSSRLYDLL